MEKVMRKSSTEKLFWEGCLIASKTVLHYLLIVIVWFNLKWNTLYTRVWQAAQRAQEDKRLPPSFCIKWPAKVSGCKGHQWCLSPAPAASVYLPLHVEPCRTFPTPSHSRAGSISGRCAARVAQAKPSHLEINQDPDTQTSPSSSTIQLFPAQRSLSWRIPCNSNCVQETPSSVQTCDAYFITAHSAHK